ncbi:DNA terminal protein [Bacillus phage GA1]|uniref:Terminal protein (TP) n=1 Tax=Bacillus phage GA-1 TaxID=2679898 RepID=Q9FZW9_BPGA1|nr:DNA terminal protein [Bacillus phage GA1]CAC21524.1 terminal protein (TP) [Bacillus phage GA1]
MARESDFRLTKAQREEVSKLSRSVKAKTTRLLKNYGQDFTGYISPKSPDDIKSIEQFNAFKKRAESFTDRSNRDFQFVKNEYGVVVSKTELDEILSDTKKAQEVAEKILDRFNDVEVISGGQSTGFTVGENKELLAKPDKGFGRIEDFDFNKVKTQEGLDRFANRAKKRSQEAYYEESLRRLQDNFIRNSVEGTFNSEADDVVSKLRSLPADDFYECFSIYNEISFENFDSENALGMASESILERVRMYVNDYFEGKSDLSLKGF